MTVSLFSFSRTLPRGLADLSIAVVWTISILPRISRSASLLARFLGIVPRTPTTIGITVTFTHSIFFSFLARSRYLSSFFSFFPLFLFCNLLGMGGEIDEMVFWPELYLKKKKDFFLSYHYYYLILFWFFTPALADGFLLEFEWQVSSSLQDSPQYSGRSC